MVPERTPPSGVGNRRGWCAAWWQRAHNATQLRGSMSEPPRFRGMVWCTSALAASLHLSQTGWRIIIARAIALHAPPRTPGRIHLI